MPESDPVPLRTVGRKPARERHATAIKEAEGKIADRLPEMAEMVLEMALGRKPEKCPAHHYILQCTDPDCLYASKGSPANERMLIYAMNRVAGTPTIAGEKQVNMEFVRILAKEVASVFKEANELETKEQRAQHFAMGITRMWISIGEAAAGGE